MVRFGISKRVVDRHDDDEDNISVIGGDSEIEGYKIVPKESWDVTPLRSYYKFTKSDGKTMSGFLVDRNTSLFTFRSDLYNDSSFTTKIGKSRVKTLYIKESSQNKTFRAQEPPDEVSAVPFDEPLPADPLPVPHNQGLNNNLFCGLDPQTSREIRGILQDKPVAVGKAELEELRSDVKKIADTLKSVVSHLNKDI
jgi:hypothetical protein